MNKRGWYGESARHSLAARGYKTVCRGTCHKAYVRLYEDPMRRVEKTIVEMPKGNLIVGHLSGRISRRHILTKVHGFIGYGSYDTVMGQTRHYATDTPSYEAAIALCGRKTPKDESGVSYEQEQIDVSDTSLCHQCVSKWLESDKPIRCRFERKRI